VNFAEIMDMLKNPQAMEARAREFKARMAQIEATGSSGGGMVRITLDGEFAMKRIDIADEVIDPAEPSLLRDLVRAAHNDAVARVREALQRELSSGSGGMGFPGDLLGGGTP